MAIQNNVLINISIYFRIRKRTKFSNKKLEAVRCNLESLRRENGCLTRHDGIVELNEVEIKIRQMTYNKHVTFLFNLKTNMHEAFPIPELNKLYLIASSFYRVSLFDI